MANSFLSYLWGYMHGLAINLIYELVVYGKSLSAEPSEISSMNLAISLEHNQSLQPTLLVIIFIYDVFRVLLSEQDTTRKGQVYEMYEMYKIAKVLLVTPNGLHS